MTDLYPEKKNHLKKVWNLITPISRTLILILLIGIILGRRYVVIPIALASFVIGFYLSSFMWVFDIMKNGYEFTEEGKIVKASP